VLASWGLEAQIDVIQLAVSELVSNAICHGSGRIAVELILSGDRVRLVVEDEGGHGAGGPVVRDQARLGGPTPGGWGLRLVDEVSDRWGVAADDGRTRVWMEKRADEGGAGGP
jgi:anti-sigma regulatory factor (Ser/Thr protein kinase)